MRWASSLSHLTMSRVDHWLLSLWWPSQDKMSVMLILCTGHLHWQCMCEEGVEASSKSVQCSLLSYQIYLVANSLFHTTPIPCTICTMANYCSQKECRPMLSVKQWWMFIGIVTKTWEDKVTNFPNFCLVLAGPVAWTGKRLHLLMSTRSCIKLIQEKGRLGIHWRKHLECNSVVK